MTQTYDKTYSQALARAEELATLVQRGDMPLAEQAERDIDDLVGRWTDTGFVWPQPIARAAGVPALRRKR